MVKNFQFLRYIICARSLKRLTLNSVPVYILNVYDCMKFGSVHILYNADGVGGWV